MDTDELLIAACEGDVMRLDDLCDAGVDPNSIDAQVGNSALYNATYTDQVAAIRCLLKRGANPNLQLNYCSPIDGREERGVVALMYARSIDAAKALVDAGADVNVADETGRTPLMRAVHRANPDVVGLLLDAGANPNQVMSDGHGAAAIAQSQIAKYESWFDGKDRAPIAKKVERLALIRDMLAGELQD